MKTIYFSILMLLTYSTQAQESFYEQLCDFNPNWKKYAETSPEGRAKKFNSDNELVANHLKSVLQILRSNPTEHLNAAQLTYRKLLISKLDEYRKAEIFPQNYYREERIPVFIDEHGTHCAVGHLLKETGYEEVAQRIANANNYAWVYEIHDPALGPWQEMSGLSMEEIKLIQGAYDFYMPLALEAPNKYEIPQKPEVITMYFDDKAKDRNNPNNIWLKGEGKNGVLDGKWIQNYDEKLPWIVGYYKNGKRSGQWEEYYQGTDKLCRTENWRNDKLNGVRTRFDREGKIIEEIYFRQGEAIVKTNYDYLQNRKYVRKPLDSNIVYTEVFDLGGSILAHGNEIIDNPGNLMWFQDIELTALNTAAITARDFSVGNDIGIIQSMRDDRWESNTFQLYNAPPLVNYLKEGDWVYYKQYVSPEVERSNVALYSKFTNYFGFEGALIHASIQNYVNEDFKLFGDSILVVYDNSLLKNLIMKDEKEFLHMELTYFEKEQLPFITVNDLQISYYDGYLGASLYPYDMYSIPHQQNSRVNKVAFYDLEKRRIGTWKYFNKRAELFKEEEYIIPTSEEDISMN